jgi:hypothetical protein
MEKNCGRDCSPGKLVGIEMNCGGNWLRWKGPSAEGKDRRHSLQLKRIATESNRSQDWSRLKGIPAEFDHCGK